MRLPRQVRLVTHLLQRIELQRLTLDERAEEISELQDEIETLQGIVLQHRQEYRDLLVGFRSHLRGIGAEVPEGLDEHIDLIRDHVAQLEEYKPW